jgi:hypothetical protein
MEVDFQTLRTRTVEGRIIRKNNVTAGLADQSAVRNSGHQAKGVIDYAVRTAIFFLGHGVDSGPEWAQAHSPGTPGSFDLLVFVKALGSRNLPQRRERSCSLGIGFGRKILPEPEDRLLRNGSHAPIQAG